jgi:protein gp37
MFDGKFGGRGSWERRPLTPDFIARSKSASASGSRRGRMMGEASKIEWTDASWSPIRARNLTTGKIGWHCEHVTTGCEFCYAEGINKRLGTGLPFKPGHRKDIEIFLDEKMLLAPLRWKRSRMVFVCSMTDLFANFVKDEWIDRCFAVMALCPTHTFQVLTKRSERMRAYCDDRGQRSAKRISKLAPNVLVRWPLPNVWLGVSAERQQEADERIPILLQTPAAVRFVSLEPLLGPISLGALRLETSSPWDALRGRRAEPGNDDIPCPRLDWAIVGGESGPHARSMSIEHARSLRDQCVAASVPFFFKQWGAYTPVGHVDRGMATDPSEYGYERVGKKAAGRLLDGRTWDEFPEAQP